MITTKAIIEKVEVIEGIIQYRVRIPLFHEIKSTSDITTNQLPLAIYPLPPHMEATLLNVGDVVYVTLEDSSLDTVVILGMIPYSGIANTFGSDSTMSKVAMNEVDSIEFNRNGSVILPCNIKIRTSTTEDLSEDNLNRGEIRNYVNGDDLINIIGLSEPVITSIEKLTESINYLEENLIHIEIRAEMLEEGTP